MPTNLSQNRFGTLGWTAKAIVQALLPLQGEFYKEVNNPILEKIQ